MYCVGQRFPAVGNCYVLPKQDSKISHILSQPKPNLIPCRKQIRHPVCKQFFHPSQIARYGRGFSFNPRSFNHAFTVKNPFDLDPRNQVIQRQTYSDDKVGYNLDKSPQVE